MEFRATESVSRSSGTSGLPERATGDVAFCESKPNPRQTLNTTRNNVPASVVLTTGTAVLSYMSNRGISIEVQLCLEELGTRKPFLVPGITRISYFLPGWRPAKHTSGENNDKGTGTICVM